MTDQAPSPEWQPEYNVTPSTTGGAFQTSESIDNLAPAMAATYAAMQQVVKNGDNPFFGSKYATLADIDNAIRPILSKNKLFAVQTAEAGEGGLWMTTRIWHTSGQWYESRVPLVMPEHADPQKCGSALTYARRYGLPAAIGLAFSDADDDDGNSLQPGVSGASGSRTAPSRGSTPPRTSAAAGASSAPVKQAASQQDEPPATYRQIKAKWAQKQPCPSCGAYPEEGEMIAYASNQDPIYHWACYEASLQDPELQAPAPEKDDDLPF